MKNPAVAVWRTRLGITCATIGLVLFLAALFPYLRYASDLNNLHDQERIRHAQTLSLLWRAGFFGSVGTGLASLFGLGWGRWVGIIANAGAFLFSAMILGAMCGPFGCS